MEAISGNAGAGFSLNLSDEDSREITEYVQNHPHELLQIPRVRDLITAARLRNLEPGSVRTLRSHSPDVIENTISHNLGAIKNLVALRRPSYLVNPLRSSLCFLKHHAQMKVLAVGPRTEAEIFALMAAGVPPENIRGLDLISYSPLVDLGDMHDMPYPDDTFGVVILGWVLGYSNDNARVAAEVLRVAQPGALIAIGHEYDPKSKDQLDADRGFALDGTGFENTGEMLALFDGHEDSVLFRHDVHPTMRDAVCHIMVVFQLEM